ncbi:tRNA preQ1(34) S-adenosylmethionine ribosyltransferase-isomerase QueA [Calycomorphotria hydatis]|uniref:S-adenosylmethionine:tRNA ribosyltransferase-isomerase n=1 Tax=Calycomorphotria hydatis TaxID=2528027 RepID=A0A517T9F1_9PLAN|nr:tRNA preQ1(34) S-adenosylmethionine ribosyltransferase-isomerase QueA [Calycomorphotria hydatis]QDT64988.1 S-adenosylmethionine:tRNA ribosyltransferase-isomerase [Calycomorphotria hydatis]
MHISAYDYDLPDGHIAEHPVEPRDAARLMVLNREHQEIQHYTVADLPKFLKSGDVLVVNNTKVIPARLYGIRAATGGKWEGLFLQESKSSDGIACWELLSQTRGKLLTGEFIEVADADEGKSDPLQLQLIEKTEDGGWLVIPHSDLMTLEILKNYGHVPLPPYIRGGTSEPADTERYQTVYAQSSGSVAAPTAGLHFTPQLLEACREKGVFIESVTLHVGVGTFRPIEVDDITAHKMHSEWCELTDEAAARINAARSSGGRLFAVGTTTVRTLESAAGNGTLKAFCGQTDIYIRPPYQFQVVDVLMTNFHLPRSSLLVLVSAFAGYEFTMHAYEEAVQNDYRFYSYGDAMLIL